MAAGMADVVEASGQEVAGAVDHVVVTPPAVGHVRNRPGQLPGLATVVGEPASPGRRGAVGYDRVGHHRGTRGHPQTGRCRPYRHDHRIPDADLSFTAGPETAAFHLDVNLSRGRPSAQDPTGKL